MIVEETKLKGCFVLTPKIFKDSRGVFFESYKMKDFEASTGVNTIFVQENQSTSIKGTLRGLHFQKGKFSQSKLLRVVLGEVLDVCVDLRQGSATFGEHFSIILDSKLNQQIFIPKGFAHGFLTLSDTAILSYKCDEYYNSESEGGIIYNDSKLAIDWSYPEEDLVLSEKDKALPTFKDALYDL